MKGEVPDSGCDSLCWVNPAPPCGKWGLQAGWVGIQDEGMGTPQLFRSSTFCVLAFNIGTPQNWTNSFPSKRRIWGWGVHVGYFSIAEMFPRMLQCHRFHWWHCILHGTSLFWKLVYFFSYLHFLSLPTSAVDLLLIVMPRLPAQWWCTVGVFTYVTWVAIPLEWAIIFCFVFTFCLKLAAQR